jgi:hypothetical protein
MNAPLIAAQSRDGALTTGGVKRRPSFSMNWAATFWGRVAALHHNPGPVGKDDFPMATVSNFPPQRQPAAGTIHWLNSCIQQAKHGVISEVVTMTPPLAAELLRRNDKNRSVRQAKVDQYAADMKAGRWTFNGEPIIIADTGDLNDGQHRLYGLVEANTSLPFLVVFGLTRESRETVDQGAARGAGDYLGMGGLPNASTCAAIARLAIAYEGSGGKFADTRPVTNAQVVARARADDGIHTAAHFASTVGRAANQYCAGTVLGFCYYVLADIDQAAADEYMTQVCTGEGLKAGCAAIAVRERLLAVGKARQPKIAIILRGWNFYRRGMKVRTSSLPATSPLPALI